MAFWGNEEKGSTMLKESLHKAGRAARRAFRPTVSAFLAFTMVFGSIPAPAYAEMIDEAAHAVAVAGGDAVQPTSEPTVGEAAGDIASQDVPNTDAPATEAPSGTDSAPAGDASADDETPVDALYAESDDLAVVTLGGEALASPDAAAQALEEAGATESAAKAAANTLFVEDAADLAAGDGDDSGIVDDTSIDSIVAKWITPSDGGPAGMGDKDGQITLRPKSDSQQTVRLRVSYALSGEYAYNPGDITITIPGSIFVDRDGSKAGKMVLSVPADPITTAGWNYRHVVLDGKDEYVITNTRRMSAASQGFMEFAFTGLTPHELVDMKDSAEFQASLEVVTREGGIINKTSNSIIARFDTEAKVTSATKRLNESPRIVAANSSEVELAVTKYPGEERFVVVDWYVNCYTEANQTFNLKLKDQVQDEYGGVILNADAENPNNATDPDAGKPSLDLDLGTKYFNRSSSYTRVSVAYPISQFENGKSYTFKNDVTYTLTETDPENGTDEQQVTVASDSASEKWTYYAPKFNEPRGHYNVFKYGNDNKPYGDVAFGTHHSTLSSTYADVESDGYTGYNGYYGLYSTALNDLADGESVDISYTLNTVGYMLPWTYKAPEDAEPGVNPLGQLKNYGQRQVSMVTEDKGVRWGDELVEGEDYDYTTVTFPIKPKVKKAVAINLKPDGTVDFTSHDDGTVDYVDETDDQKIPTVEVQVKRGKSDNWETVATASWSTGSLQITRPGDAAVQTDPVVALPEDTTAVRTSTTSSVAGMLFFARVGIRLNPSEKMVAKAKGSFDESTAPIELVENDATMNASYADTGVSIVSIDKTGTDKLMGYTTDVRAEMTKSTKRFDLTSPDNDVANSRVKVHFNAKVNKRSFITNREVYEQALANGDLLSEESGTFYDLLPKGMTPILEDVKLREDDAITSIHTIENYRQTGRTMLVVEADLEPQIQSFDNGGGVKYYQDVLEISIDAWYSYQDVLDYGEDFHNVIAYQSDNEAVGTVDGYEGEPDSPRGPDYNNVGTERAFKGEPVGHLDEVLDAMTNLDNEDSTKYENTLYAGSEGSVDPLGHGANGLYKQVSVNANDWFGTGVGDSPDQDVYTGGSYVYRLSTTTDAGTYLKDLVIYDSMENFIPGKGNADESEANRRWRGVIRSIDVSQIEDLGCEPVVYYSTTHSEPGKGLFLYKLGDNESTVEIKENTNLSNEQVWTKLKTPQDLMRMSYTERKEITAIAIDASRDKDGNAFELKPNTSVAALVYMTAPSGEEAQEIIKSGKHAYNNVCRAGSTKGGAASAWDERKFIHEDYTKVGLTPYNLNVEKTWDDDDNRDGVRPESVNVQLLRNGDALEGRVATLSQKNEWSHTFENLDYLDPYGNKYVYTLREYVEGENALEGYTPSIKFDGTTFTLENRHKPERVRVSGKKIWKGDTQAVRPDRIEVKLLANGKVVKTQTVRPNGSNEWEYSFDNLYKCENGQEIVYTVEENLLGESSYIPDVEDTNIVNVYHPFGDLVLSKATEGDTSAAATGRAFEFTFTFLKDGVPVFDEFAYQIAGEGIEEGDVVAGMVSTDGTISIKGGQSVRIEEIPEDITYIVTETAQPGFAVEGSGTAQGTIVPNKDNTVAFKNVYSAQGEVSLVARKRVIGHDLSPYRFVFELKDEEGNVVRTASNGRPENKPGKDEAGNMVAEADVVFGALAYTQKDDGKTFTYTMSERTQGGDGYECSKDIYKVKVTPCDAGDGTMKIGVQYLDVNGQPLDEGSLPTFENVYTATGEITLQAHKTLKGGKLNAGQFRFQLGKVIVSEDTSTFEQIGNDEANAADGSVKFPAITYDQTDVGSKYLYAIREVVPGDDAANKTTYDEHVALIEVEVTDNHDGTLGIEMTMDGVKAPCFVCGATGQNGDEDCPACDGGIIISSSQDLEFVNEYAPAGLDIQKTLAEGSGADDPNHLFTYELELTNEQGEPLNELNFDGAYLEPVDGGAPDQGDAATAAVAGDSTDASVADAAKSASGNPIVDFATSAFDALVSLLAPTPAYAAEAPEPPTEEGWTFENKGSWWWKIDNDSVLTIGGTNIKPSKPGLGGNWDKWPWHENNEKFTSVRFVSGSKALNVNNMFRSCSYLQSVDFSGLDTSQVVEMHRMFNGCSGLTSLDLTSLNTSNVQTMNAMFSGCSGLTSLDLSSFVTSNVTDMGGMFANCPRLVSLDLTSLDTSKVEDMSAMFGGCSGLTSLDLTSLDTSKVEDMTAMFRDCSSLDSLDLNDLDTSNVTNMSRMFVSCKGLKSINFGNIDTSNVTDMRSMFEDCSGLTALGLSSFDTSNVEDMGGMFSGCKGLTSIDLSSFSTSNVEDMGGMFEDCSLLTFINLGSLDTSNVTKMGSMFKYCSGLTALGLSSFDTSNVEDMGGMFSGCKGLTSIDLSSFSTSNVEDMGGMFEDCSGLTALGLSSFSTSNVTDMRSMFSGCKGLTSIDLSSFSTSNVTDMRSMFSGCKGLTSIDLSSFSTSNVEDMGGMFEDCSGLTALDLSGFNTESVKSMSFMFSSCESLISLDLSSFNTTDLDESAMMSVFAHTSALRKIVLGVNFRFNGNSLYQGSYSGQYEWILVGSDGVPAEGVESYSSEELAEKYPTTGVGTYVWDSFATFEFNPGEGGIGSAKPQKADVLEDVVLSSPSFVRFGYKISGWKVGEKTYPIAEDGKIVIPAVDAKDLFKKSEDGRIVLTAQWEKTGGITFEEGKYTFQIPAGYVLHLPDVIPSGTRYKVTELDEDGWKLVESSGEVGMVSSQEKRPVAAFVNAEESPENPTVRVQLGAAKMLDGAWAQADSFSFRMSGYDPASNSDACEWITKVAAGGAVTFPALEFSMDDLGNADSKVFDYTIKEVEGTDNTIQYDTSTVVAHVTIAKVDGKLTQSVSYVHGSTNSEAEPVFRNVTKPGSLSITKIAKGAIANGPSAAQEFSFRLTVDGKAYEGAYKVGEKSFETADGLIKLTGGQTATVNNLAAGSSYTVDEIEIPKGWKLEGKDGFAGTVAADTTQKIEFTNSYSAEGSVQLMAHKSFPGGGLEQDQFSFALYDGSYSSREDLPADKLLGTVTNGMVDAADKIPGKDEAGNDIEVDNPYVGMAPVYFPEISYRTEGDESVEGQYGYTIVEVIPVGDALLPGVIYDTAIYHAIVTVTDRGDGTLKTEVAYTDVEGKPLEGDAVFTNTPQSVGLSLKKVVTNDPSQIAGLDNLVFDFKVAFSDAAGNALAGQKYQVVADDGTAGSESTVPDDGIIQLRAGDTARFTSLPYGVGYAIEEVAKLGWTSEVAEGSAELSGTLTDVDKVVAVEVANTYDASAELKILAKKHFDGELTDGMFTFNLVEVCEGGEVVLRQQATNNADGIIEFGALSYTLEDVGRTFTYKVMEEDSGDEGVAYDDTVYRIDISVSDKGDGTLVLNATYRNETENLADVGSDGIVFNNLRAFKLPFTGGSGIGMAGVAVLVLGCAAYLIDRTRRRKV